MLKNLVVDHNPIAKVAESVFSKWSLLSKLTDYLHGLLCGKREDTLRNALFLFGITAITYKATALLWRGCRGFQWLPTFFIRQGRLSSSALKERYGNCYVLITGFTEGIGYCFAETLAEMGFNLLLISRTKQKVVRVGQRLRGLHPNVSIEYCTCDLSDRQEIANLETLLRRYEELDIGIVVNNAGSSHREPYFNIDPSLLIADANVDLIAQFQINRILLPRLRARRHRAAIVNLSSCTGVFLSPYLGVYSSAKHSLDRYSRTLGLENSDRVDVLSVRPFGVATKMMDMKKGAYMISPRQCVVSTLADLLAGASVTFTHLDHCLSGTVFATLTEEEGFKMFEAFWQASRSEAH